MPGPMTDGAVRALAADFRGELIDPGHPGFDAARRVWNGSVDRKPALIARCGAVADVVAAVRVAAEHDLLVAVRGGGHSFPGLSTCDDGLVIDLSGMSSVRVDEPGRTAWVQGGATWADVVRLQVFVTDNEGLGNALVDLAGPGRWFVSGNRYVFILEHS